MGLSSLSKNHTIKVWVGLGMAAQLFTGSAFANKVDYGLNVFKGLVHETKGTQNVLVSPSSLKAALAVLLTGASDREQLELAKAFGYSDFKHMQDETYYSTVKEKGFKLFSSSAVYMNSEPGKMYSAEVERVFGATPAKVDFRDAGTAKKVNDWVSESTEKMIKDIVSADEVSHLNFLAVNTTYLDADWQKRFKPHGKDQFKDENGKPVLGRDGVPWAVDYMDSARSNVRFDETETYRAYEIDYVDYGNNPKDGHPHASMLIFQPKHGRLLDFAPQLDAKMLAKLDLKLKRSKGVSLRMPRFAMNYELGTEQAKALLGHLGQGETRAGFIFSHLDLSKMVDAHKDKLVWEKNKVGLLKQKTRIIVRERGTTAAAATAVGAERTAIIGAEPPRVLDSPYIYLIRDKFGNILFVGSYLDPSSMEAVPEEDHE